MSAIVSMEEHKKNVKRKVTKEAFDWAVSEQRRLGLMAEPLNVIFDEDSLELEDKNCIVSVFYNEDTNRAIMRRDWTDIMAVKYNILTNLSQIKKVAPQTTELMMDNAIKMYYRYSKRGGVTRINN